jgi:hypothetical protein
MQFAFANNKLVVTPETELEKNSFKAIGIDPAVTTTEPILIPVEVSAELGTISIGNI